MQTLCEVPQQYVFNEWKKAGNFQGIVTDELPSETRWYEARTVHQDIAGVAIIRSCDWDTTFGTYDPFTIARTECRPNDKHNHRERICGMADTLLGGGTFAERPILIAPSQFAPFTAIDGNHRLLAAIRVGGFVGMDVFLGVHPEMYRGANMQSWRMWDQRPDGLFRPRFDRSTDCIPWPVGVSLN